MDQQHQRLRILLLTGMGLGYILLALFSDWWLRIHTQHTAGADFFIYYDAYLKTTVGENPYLPFKVGSSFIYHPSALTLISLVGWLPPVAAYLLWAAASTLAWAITARIIIDELSKSVPLSAFRKNLIFLFSLTFAPFLEGVYLGQINAFVILAIILAIQWSDKEQHAKAGIALACAILWKTSPILFAAYFLAAKRYRTVLWTVLGIVVLSSIAVLQFTHSVFFDYLPILDKVGKYVELGPYNQSLGALLVRPLTRAGWNSSELLFAGRAVCATIFVGWLARLWLRCKNISLFRTSFFVFCFVVLLSPLVWYHHLMFVLPPLVYLFRSQSALFFCLGTVLGCLIQAQRYFEYAISPLAIPVNVAVVTLALLYWMIDSSCLSRRTEFQSHPNPILP